MAKVYQAQVKRPSGLWEISVPELGAVTQARSFDEAEKMARELVALETGTEFEDARVDLLLLLD